MFLLRLTLCYWVKPTETTTDSIFIRETVSEIDVILGQAKLKGKSETESDLECAMEVIILCIYNVVLENKMQVRWGKTEDWKTLKT